MEYKKLKESFEKYKKVNKNKTTELADEYAG